MCNGLCWRYCIAYLIVVEVLLVPAIIAIFHKYKQNTRTACWRPPEKPYGSFGWWLYLLAVFFYSKHLWVILSTLIYIYTYRWKEWLVASNDRMFLVRDACPYIETFDSSHFKIRKLLGGSLPGDNRSFVLPPLDLIKGILDALW